MKRLQHDCSFALATALVEIIENLLRPEERRECWSEFYSAARAALEAYEAQAERMRQRMQPSKN